MAKRTRLRQIMRSATLLLGLLLGLWSFTYVFPRGPRGVQLRPLPAFPGPTRLLVIAPHQDDETLAAAGLIQSVQAAGGQAWVCFVTAGDGFTLAADVAAHRLLANPQAMLALGRLRRQEAQDALGVLGVPPERIIPLGFPDGGLTPLWLSPWTTPWVSPHTGENRVPYDFARQPGAWYSGTMVLTQLQEVLDQVQPSTVLIPHPNDAHPDHWATHNFSAAALYHYAKVHGHSPVILHYLVHRGDWPAPKGYRPTDRLMPPATLLGGTTDWTEEELTAPQAQVKEEALRRYRSQTMLLNRFLLSFVRSTEPWGRLTPSLLVADRPPLLLTSDPRGDTIARRLHHAADITGLLGRVQGDALVLTLRLAGPPAAGERYEWDLRTYTAGQGWTRGYRAGLMPGHRPTLLLDPSMPSAGSSSLSASDTGWEQSGSELTLRLPLHRLGHPQAVGVAARTFAGQQLVDQSAWTLVTLQRPAP